MLTGSCPLSRCFRAECPSEARGAIPSIAQQWTCDISTLASQKFHELFVFCVGVGAASVAASATCLKDGDKAVKVREVEKPVAVEVGSDGVGFECSHKSVKVGEIEEAIGVEICSRVGGKTN